MWHSDEILVVFRNHLNTPCRSKKGWKWTDFLANTVSCIICIWRLMIFSKGDRLGCWSSWIVLSDGIWLTSHTRCVNYCCITAENLEPRWGVLMCKRALRACKNNRKACLSWHGWNSQMYAFVSCRLWQSLLNRQTKAVVWAPPLRTADEEPQAVCSCDLSSHLGVGGLSVDVWALKWPPSNRFCWQTNWNKCRCKSRRR